MKVLVAGASGFVGSVVVRRLLRDGDEPVAATRGSVEPLLSGTRYVSGVDLLDEQSWVPALEGVEAVVLAAARVHVMRDSAADPLREFRRVNVEGSLNVARAAARAGVRRLVFISSIKVNGETSLGGPFRADQDPNPTDAYGISKMEAEAALFAFGRSEGMEIVAVRPPLVYGPGVKANFLSLMRLLRRGIPLPLGAVQAKRSLVAVDNLADLITLCLRHPAAAGRVFLASDGEDLAVNEMIRRLSLALDRRPRLLPVPPRLIELAARAMGKEAVAQRLCMPLQVDIGPTRQLLGWDPPYNVDESFRRTAAHFLEINP